MEILGTVFSFAADVDQSSTEHFALLRDFAIVMAVAGGAVVLFRFLKQPPILGFLLGGLLVGPYTFDNPPVENQEHITALADLGLIVLLFSLGLDLGWKKLRSVGLRVVVIGILEISLMMSLGYEIGTLLGWTGTDSIFLGAALSISSTAILYKMLKDSGQLHHVQGRIIVGILVIEDIAAVILLTVLSGVATTGTVEPGAVGSLALKLVIFGFAALAIGGLVAPWAVRFISKYKSEEIMLLSCLAMCFGLALIAQELDVSPAAGAFLVGAVLGDTNQSERLVRIVSPVKDFFAALFFISIGMLVDISEVADHIGPALMISAVFIGGKLVADTVATFVTGEDGRTSLKVGTGMTQIGEFSLAIVSTGALHGAVSPFLYPVVAVATGITSLFYPFIFRSADPLANVLEKLSPRVARQYLNHTTEWIRTTRRLLQLRSENAIRVQNYWRLTLMNASVIILLLIVGSVVMRFNKGIADAMNISEQTVGLVIGGGVIALGFPATIGIWWSLRKVADGVGTYINDSIAERIPVASLSPSSVYRRGFALIMRDGLLLLLMVVLFIWSIPLVSQLLFLGSITTPVTIAVVVLISIAGLYVSSKIYKVIARGLIRTFMPDIEDRESEDKEANPKDGLKRCVGGEEGGRDGFPTTRE